MVSRIYTYCSLLLVVSLTLAACSERKIDFSTEVKPILNKRCISCHGGVKRNAEFSLLFRHEALDTTESGKPAIIPFHANKSEMIRRLTLSDPEERMPYKEEPLSKEEIHILTKWINQGAEWGDHWAYVKPKPVEIPAPNTLRASTGKSSFLRNEIDNFVLSKLEAHRLNPSNEADRATLVRRLYLDLIGIPPTVEQAEAFINNRSQDAYETLVDTLLQSPRFGEKWASWWLDLARYADTKGYERDVGRTIWRYRDWVIQAFNKDMPFDQFTIEQLAGDLLPNPSDAQLIATGFHRNTMNNDEGGTEDEEFRVAALIDRVNTTWEVWQSTTMACVQCHSHPYDPFVHADYYKSMAFLNNTRDEDTHGEHPNLRFYEPSDEKKLTQISNWIREVSNEEEARSTTLFLKTLEPKYHAHDFDAFENGELIDTKFLGIRNNGSARLKAVNLSGKDYLLFNYFAATPGKIEIRLDSKHGKVIGTALLRKTEGWNRTVFRTNLEPVEGKHDLYFLFSSPGIAKGQVVCDIEWVAFRAHLPGVNKPGYKDVDKTFMTLLDAPVENSPIMIKNPADQSRKSYVFERGNWLVKGKEISPGVPESLNPFLSSMPNNRLGFARWLVHEDNPLASRTIVNRVWEQLFGYGIVETLEDFGTQGAPPSHPELLDWLSLELMHAYDWRLKRLIKLIVMSGTYRQDARVDPKILEQDPSNRWLARGPRVRLSAEQVRDQALAASGLLSDKMFGPSVMPFQPAGIWNSVWSGEYWKQSEGADQYRRSVYTYIKRTSPYPAFMMFDASSREVCLSRRIRTNTPLQALVTLNDSTYVVASRFLAKKMSDVAKEPQEQIRYGYKRLVFKDIKEEKLRILTNLYSDAHRVYKQDNNAAQQVIASKEGNAELAALTIVAQALLNLDEVLTKE